MQDRLLQPALVGAGVVVARLGIGDDCALVQIPQGHELAITVDTMVEDIHFLKGTDPGHLGHKLLAVNLSDLAAMGAEPLWCTLALTLPELDPLWIEAFLEGFLSLAKSHHIELIGGDTTQGPRAMTVQALGKVPTGQALRRSHAKVGDLIYVSGQIGGAGLGLKIRQNLTTLSDKAAIDALECPTPRTALGQDLRGIAHACIDISDGLLADLGHILSASKVGASIDIEAIPLLASVRSYCTLTGDIGFPLMSGDDYELCFTVPSDKRSQVDSLLRQHRLQGGVIGVIVKSPGLDVQQGGKALQLKGKGYEHFKSGT
ncbi:MAG: thiamine-phosphate kinase [Methylococcaceae bacterium]